jgi:hypothetical protein
MKLNEIKYKGPKIDQSTRFSDYQLVDHSLGSQVEYTGSFRQCWIRRAYLAQHDNIANYEIRLLS